MRAPISVVIPTLNAGESLPGCLAALGEGLQAGLIRELIVSDGGSDDATLEISEAAGAVLIEGMPSRGGQLRRGAGAAQGAWFLFLHADSWLAPGWSEAALAHMESDKAGYFRLRFDRGGLPGRVVAGWANLRSRLFGLPFGDQGLLIPRDLYDALGGYPDIPLMEDVALARALAKAPKLLLLDEPLGALDAKLRQQTQFELMDIQEKTGTTFVIVTHDQEEAMTVASRVAVMDNGKVIQVDTPARIYETPNSVYVADFIGEVNLLEGSATLKEDGLASLSWAEGKPELIGTAGEGLANGARATFAIRPEKVAISAERPEDVNNVVQGRIHDIAYLGNISTYHVVLDDGTIIKAQTANNRRLSRRNFTWEDEVWLSWTDTAGLVLAS